MEDYDEDEEEIDLADIVGAIAIALAIGAAAGAIIALLSRAGRR